MARLATEPTLVEVVFGRPDRGHGRRLGIGAAASGLVVAFGAAWLALHPPVERPRGPGPVTRRTEASVETITPRLAPPPRVREPTAPPPLPVRPVEAAATPAAPEPAAPVAAPAKASRVVTSARPTPLDFTGSTMPTGDAAHAPGGATQTGGNGEEPGEAPLPGPLPVPPVPQPPPEPPPERKPEAPPKATDQSRPVRLADADDWRCPWPDEADEAQIDAQTVIVRVTVDAEGQVVSARAAGDPGYGFAGAAVACAKERGYEPALNASGEPVRAESPPIRVRFTR